jgi:ribonuclease HI
MSTYSFTKKPLSDGSMQAILKLTEVATEKKEKKMHKAKGKKGKAKNKLAGKLSKALMSKKKPKQGKLPLEGVAA